MTPKAIGDQAFNMATMCAFAIPEAGPVIAAVIGVAEGFFNIFVPDLTPPSGMQSLDKQDLKDAVSELIDHISDSLFKNDVDNATTWILNFNSTQLLNNIAKAQGLGLDSNTLFFPRDQTVDNTRVALKAFFLPAANTLQDLQDNRDVFTRSNSDDASLTPEDLAAHRTETIGVYCLAGSAEVLFLKTAVAWQWAEELLYTGAYPKWLAAQKAWLKRDQSYKDNHPNEEPDLLYPGVNTYSDPLKEWQDWAWTKGSTAELLKTEVANLLTHSIYDDVNKVDGLYKVMVQNWEARHTAMVADLNLPGWIQSPLPLPLYNVLGEVEVGIHLAETWETTSRKYSLQNVTYKDLKLYYDSLNLWQDALEALKFQTVTALDGDTPRTIALRVYKDASLYSKLTDVNDKPFADGDMRLAGIRVKAPDLNVNRVTVPDLPTNKF